MAINVTINIFFLSKFIGAVSVLISGVEVKRGLYLDTF